MRVERFDNRLRLVILLDELELACRKERKKILLTFLNTSESRLFKGRIQLYIHNHIIDIELNKILIGQINSKSFSQLLNLI